jgi:hypothetical protein
MVKKLSVSLCRDRLRGPRGVWAALFVAALAICLALITATDSWRSAAAAAFAAGVLLATRIRFARVLALALVVVVALVAVGGAAPGQDMRPARPRGTAMGESSQQQKSVDPVMVAAPPAALPVASERRPRGQGCSGPVRCG